jgi:Flp pilus assembly protein TadG
MALVLFILAFLLVGIVDFGRAFHHYIVVTNAAREGARFGSRIPDDDTLIKDATIQEAAESGVDISTSDFATITITPANPDSRTSGTPLNVSINYTYTTFIGGLVGLPKFNIRAGTEMRVFGLDQ